MNCQRCSHHPRHSRPSFGELLWSLLLAVAIVVTLLPEPADAAEAGTRRDVQDIETQLGIRVVGLRRSAAGYMLDFRYRLLDPVKASPLLDRKIRPYLLDETHGAQLRVPDAPKVGQLRPTSRNNVIPGRTYYILFANPGRYLGPGSQATLIAGDVRIPHLTVE